MLVTVPGVEVSWRTMRRIAYLATVVVACGPATTMQTAIPDTAGTDRDAGPGDRDREPVDALSQDATTRGDVAQPLDTGEAPDAGAPTRGVQIRRRGGIFELTQQPSGFSPGHLLVELRRPGVGILAKQRALAKAPPTAPKSAPRPRAVARARRAPRLR